MYTIEGAESLMLSLLELLSLLLFLIIVLSFEYAKLDLLYVVLTTSFCKRQHSKTLCIMSATG